MHINVDFHIIICE